MAGNMLEMARMRKLAGMGGGMGLGMTDMPMDDMSEESSSEFGMMPGLLKFIRGLNANAPIPDRKMNIPFIEDNMYKGGNFGTTGGSGYFDSMGSNFDPPEGY